MPNFSAFFDHGTREAAASAIAALAEPVQCSSNRLRERSGKSGTRFLRPTARSDIERAQDPVANRSHLANHAPTISGEISMIITTAHIPAIVALIAGILILIMPRLLNLVVAIYLICIGLIGLGLLKWLHM